MDLHLNEEIQHVVYCQFAIDVEVEVRGSASRIKPHFAAHIYPRRATIKQFSSFEHHSADHCPVLMPTVDDVIKMSHKKSCAVI